MRKICRVSYIHILHRVVPSTKIVLEKLDNKTYRTSMYKWNNADNKWEQEEIIDQEINYLESATGGVDHYFDMLVKYSGYETVAEGVKDTESYVEMHKIKMLNN